MNGKEGTLLPAGGVFAHGILEIYPFKIHFLICKFLSKILVNIA